MMTQVRTTSCILCGGEATYKTTMPLDAKTFKSISHGAVYECSTCALSFIYPRPTPEQTIKFYDLDSYYTRGASHMIPMEPTFWSRLRVHLAWRVDRSSRLVDVITNALPVGSSIVDIGCGGGDLIRQLGEKGYRAIGVERDASAVSFRNENITMLEGSVESLPPSLARGSVDGVVFSHVLEHLSDPAAALRQASSLLKSTGLLFCEVPNNESAIAEQSGLAWEHLDIPRHINFFTERSLSVAASHGGLTTTQTYFAGFCRYFTDSYIATEQRIFDQLAAVPNGPADSTRNSQARAWQLLARTAFSRARIKYDSVGIVARLS
jgi:SAM-dependent methyltransferase